MLVPFRRQLNLPFKWGLDANGGDWHNFTGGVLRADVAYTCGSPIRRVVTAEEFFWGVNK
jgi:hypothetical protein